MIIKSAIREWWNAVSAQYCGSDGMTSDTRNLVITEASIMDGTPGGTCPLPAPGTGGLYTFTVYWVSDILDGTTDTGGWYTQGNPEGWGNYTSSPTQTIMIKTEDTKDLTRRVVHEFGHSMGLHDTYTRGSDCMAGQPESVMCHERWMNQDDIDGVNCIYCNNRYPNAGADADDDSIQLSPAEKACGQLLNTACGNFAKTAAMKSAAAPEISPDTNVYPGPFDATLSSSTPGSTIYYTTDGTFPTTASPRYTGPIRITSSTILHAMATAPDMANSGFPFAAYEISAPAVPAASLAGSLPAGSYAGMQSVSLTAIPSTATIYFTTDGSAPSTQSAVYKTAIQISKNTTIRAFAQAAGYSDSTPWSASYTFATAKPVFSLAVGTLTTPSTVNLASATTGAVIYFTVDGSAPSPASRIYQTPVPITSPLTLRAMAQAPGFSPSDPVTAQFSVPAPAAPPYSSLPSGAYVGPRTVALYSSNPGAVIHFTLDGSTPTINSPIYSGPILVSKSLSLKALAGDGGWVGSPVALFNYVIVSSIPVFTPSGGIVPINSKVGLSTATYGGIIHYTLDGSMPTAASPVYFSPIPITKGVTIFAITVTPGMQNSPVQRGSFTPR